MINLLQFENREIPVFHGESVASALRKNKILIAMECGGKNLCGKCRIKLLAGSFITDGKILTGSVENPPEANACALRMLSTRGRAEFAFSKSKSTDADLHGEQSDADALAIDLGTTNIAAALVRNGKIIRSAETQNRQILHGDNVIDRIAFAADPESKQKLFDLLIKETIDPLIRKLTDSAEKIKFAAVAGNTVMTHFFFKKDPSYLGKAPFEPQEQHFSATASQLGLTALNPETPITGAEHICGFIGGDISAGLLASNFGSSGDCELFIDNGTNCEMVLCANGKFYALSAAAGPAFERTHCRADHPDCIRHAAYQNGKWQFEPAAAVPAGPCGSALIDLLAELHRNGFINDQGILQKDTGLPEKLQLPNHAIAELITAKAAISSGLTILLKHADIRQQEIKKVILAGNFSQHIDPANARYLGILPDIPDERFLKAGNLALAGAAQLAGNPDLFAESGKWKNRVIHINPAEEPDYMKYFASAMSLRKSSPFTKRGEEKND